MKKKILIVQADYYTDISNGLLKTAKSRLKNLYSVKIIKQEIIKWKKY